MGVVVVLQFDNLRDRTISVLVHGLLRLRRVNHPRWLRGRSSGSNLRSGCRVNLRRWDGCKNLFSWLSRRHRSGGCLRNDFTLRCHRIRRRLRMGHDRITCITEDGR